MTEYRGQLRGTGRVAVLVSQYNERVTTRLLEGALSCCRNAGLPDDQVDVIWLPGAFELGGAASAAAATGRYTAIVGLGAVIRGD
ncbi:MAG TPA: 6,7-dimethyl-8-ribityllumazine synthase, partial [Gemmatimonadales bacterium]|nr:6,7-dimethyl-8-ribityllumazine synthase [Gemmatimonadales bacterium]